MALGQKTHSIKRYKICTANFLPMEVHPLVISVAMTTLDGHRLRPIKPQPVPLEARLAEFEQDE
jgi:hypothetical protein